MLRAISRREFASKRAFELGCGNGYTANRLSELGFSVSGIDSSETGVLIARSSYPHLDLHIASAYEDLAAKFGRFPLVLSIEVIEHLLEPHIFSERFYDLLEPGGVGIITTPYHGWLKNVAISVSGHWDKHHTSIWDGGHVKFFSPATLTEILCKAKFRDIHIQRVGRVPPLAKSMIATFTR
jgi:2-polyprenyl-3-methyl-5-hydroxy-6-metoxy-1,4-benzoquinol methylase